MILAQAGKDNLERKPSVDHRARIHLPEGETITSVVHKVNAQVAEGAHLAHAIRDIAHMSHQTFQMARDLVMLAERTDLNPEDAVLAKRVLEEAEVSRRVRRGWEEIRSVAERLWGKKGNRMKADRVRIEKFDSAINFVLGACEAASDIEIPYVNEASVGQKIEKLEEAVSSLHRLMERIRESAHD